MCLLFLKSLKSLLKCSLDFLILSMKQSGSSTTSDSETTVLIEVSDSDAEVSEVDASEIISVSETLDDTVVLSDTSDGATETIVLVVF